MAFKMKKIAAQTQQDKFASHMADVVAEPVTSSTQVVYKKGSKPDKTGDSCVEHSGVTMSDHEVYRLGFAGSRTINLGNFESCRVEVTVNIPCTKGGLEDAYEFASQFVSEKIAKEIAEAKG